MLIHAFSNARLRVIEKENKFAKTRKKTVLGFGFEVILTSQ